MALALTRNTGESWRQAAMRLAAKHGLEGEVGDAYQKYIEQGDTEEDAAWAACYDWDLLPPGD